MAVILRIIVATIAFLLVATVVTSFIHARHHHSAMDVPAAAAPAQRTLRLEVTDHDANYVETDLQGWRVIVRRDLINNDQTLASHALALLDAKLASIAATLPSYRVDTLRNVPIWLEGGVPGLNGLTYHWSADWLREHGYNPEKAHGVEITNAREFIDWEPTQPWFVLHELAHAFHDRALSGRDEAVKAAYDHALRSGLYASVPRNNGSLERAYALTNYREYFAELTEAYFGRNDFFPFNREELQRYDPEGFAMIKQFIDL